MTERKYPDTYCGLDDSKTLRDKIIRQIDKCRSKESYDQLDVVMIADWVLADRRRILEPLMYWKKEYRGTTEEISYPLFKSICETLKNSGVENE